MARKTSRKKRGTLHPLREWRKENNVTQQGLAAMIAAVDGHASQGLITRWETGLTKVSAERAMEVERATAGGVSRSTLRPDLWPANETATA